ERKIDNSMFDFSVEEPIKQEVLPTKLEEAPSNEQEIKPPKIEDLKPKIDEKQTNEILEDKRETESKFEVKKAEILPNFVRKFNLRYLSFDVADLVLEGNAQGYFRVYSKTNGFIDYLFGWRDYSISHFNISDDIIKPKDFKTKLLFKKKVREIEIFFSDDGKKVASDKVTPPDNRAKRPAVPDNLKIAVYDPLTAGIEARRLVIDAVEKNNFNSKGRYNFSLPIYEGRRRTDLMFDISNKKIDGMFVLKMYRKAVAGYTDNEMQDIKKGDAVIDIYLDAKNFLPVKAEGKNFLGTARGLMVKDCKNFEECVGK
ncbi:MAG: DUF3108 domain-containing protein, partial [Rickettsiales bacterium]|nr:DUF3108 domain-containing protein [Rickettsiales bacterium]